MKSEEVLLVTNFNSIWFWNLLGYINLMVGILLMGLPRTLFNKVFSIALFLIAIICFFTAQYKKREMFTNETNG